MVADRVLYHPSVAHYLRYIATTIGRDKLLRAIQYFSRFYAWYLYRTNRPEAASAPYATIKTQFGLTRKILRVGKFVEHFKLASELYDATATVRFNAGDQILQYLAVLRQLGYAFYLTFDTLTVLDALGARKSATAKRLQMQAYKAWLIGLVASALAGILSTYRFMRQAEIMAADEKVSKEDIQSLKKKRAATNLQLISDLCDLTIPSSALGYAKLDDGLVGLAGVLSSLIGVRTTWQKTR